MLLDSEPRTIPQRVLTTTPAELRPAERAGFLALSLILGAASYFFFRRATQFTNELPELSSTSVSAIMDLQRTITIRASMAEVELFFVDPPRLQGYELGRDLHLRLAMKPGPAGGGTELQGQLSRWPSHLSPEEADRLLRDVLRSSKQLIEAGEIAVSS